VLSIQDMYCHHLGLPFHACCMHWTGWRTDDGAYYRVLIEGLEHDTEVDLAQDEHDNWKLGHVQTPDENWTVIDLGHFDDEGCLWPLMTDWPSCWSGRS
jgi:hypothetical protein